MRLHLGLLPLPALLACARPEAADSGAALGDPAQDCTLEGQLEHVHALVSDVYLWWDEIPELDPLVFPAPDELMDAMRYAELDHWSYVAEIEEYSSWYEEGKYIGMGFLMAYDEEGAVRFSLVYPDSPAGRAGLQRGERLVAVNGLTIADIERANAWDTIWGAWEPGTPETIEVEGADGEVRTVDLSIDWVEIVTVPVATVLETGVGRVGYLVVTAFVDETVGEVGTAFAAFAEAGVDRVVVDLRFNGGGRMSASGDLASHLVGGAHAGEVFLRVTHNERYADQDDEMRFEQPEAALDLAQVGFLTSGRTASASETLMSGMLPWVEELRVGTTTVGKPVGMDTWTWCDLAIVPISFRVANAEGHTDYFDGLAPDCEVRDDYRTALGDPTEPLLATLLQRWETGSCPLSLAPQADGPERPIRRRGAAPWAEGW